MAYSIDWKSAQDHRDLVHMAVQSVAEGQLVILPTETTYLLACSALHPIAVEKLLQIYQQRLVSDPTLLLRAAAELRDYEPKPSPVMERVSSRVWPGPLVLQISLEHSDSLMRQFPVSLREMITSKDHEARFRVAAHPAVTEVLRLCPGPLLTGEIRQGESGWALDGKTAASTVGRFAGLIVDDGPTHFQMPATVLAVANNHCRLLREGAMKREEIHEITRLIILLVCTGNTCRSPMAEVLLQQKLEDRFRNFFVENQPAAIAISAGTNASHGGSASVEAIQAMKARGLDLSSHCSKPINGDLLNAADIVLTMTQNHRQALLGKWPQFGRKVYPLSSSGRDVADPFGGSQQVYLAAAAEIEHFLEELMTNLDESLLPQWD